MRITRPLAAMLAVSIAAFAVPAAHARQPDAAQADMHASVALAAAKASQQQDRRSTDAAARPTTTAAPADASTKQSGTHVAGVEPPAPASSTDEGGSANGLGALAGLAVIGLAYLYTRRGHRATL